MYDLLLTGDPSAWPWHAFLNLPLIPLALILSRAPLPSRVAPLVPVLLAWPTSTPVPTRERMLMESWRVSSSLLASDVVPAPWASWPPSPAFVGILVLPLARYCYKTLFTRFTHWVLKTTPSDRPPVMRLMVAMNAPIRIRIGADIERPPERPHPQQLPNADADADADAALALAAEDVIHVTGSSLGRLIGGALIVPTISSLMGSLLFRLSHSSPLLRRFLAVRPSMMDIPPPLGTWSYKDNWTKLSPIRQIGVAARLVFTVALRGTRTWAECDPVWYVMQANRLVKSMGADCVPCRWRNSLGLGIFVVVCCYFIPLCWNVLMP
jgi:hypothetical protein